MKEKKEVDMSTVLFRLYNLPPYILLSASNTGHPPQAQHIAYQKRISKT